MAKRIAKQTNYKYLKLVIFVIGLSLVTTFLTNFVQSSRLTQPNTINQIGHDAALPSTNNQAPATHTTASTSPKVVHNYAPHGVLADNQPTIAHNEGQVSPGMHQGPSSCPEGQILVYHSNDTVRSCISSTDQTCGNVGFYHNGRCYWPGEHVGTDQAKVCDWNVPHNQTDHKFPFISSNCPAPNDHNQKIVKHNEQTCRGEGWWNPTNKHCYQPGEQLPASELIVCKDSNHATPQLALPQECESYQSHLQPKTVLPPADLVSHTCSNPSWTFNKTTMQCEAPQPPCQPGVAPDGHSKTECHEDGRHILTLCPQGKFNASGECHVTPESTPHSSLPSVDKSHDTNSPASTKSTVSEVTENPNFGTTPHDVDSQANIELESVEFTEEELQSLQDDPSLWEEFLLWIQGYFLELRITH